MTAQFPKFSAGIPGKEEMEFWAIPGNDLLQDPNPNTVHLVNQRAGEVSANPTLFAKARKGWGTHLVLTASRLLSERYWACPAFLTRGAFNRQ